MFDRFWELYCAFAPVVLCLALSFVKSHTYSGVGWTWKLLIIQSDRRLCGQLVSDITLTMAMHGYGQILFQHYSVSKTATVFYLLINCSRFTKEHCQDLVHMATENSASYPLRTVN